MPVLAHVLEQGSGGGFRIFELGTEAVTGE
jgi:hypothetical protein